MKWMTNLYYPNPNPFFRSTEVKKVLWDSVWNILLVAFVEISNKFLNKISYTFAYALGAVCYAAELRRLVMISDDSIPLLR